MQRCLGANTADVVDCGPPCLACAGNHKYDHTPIQGCADHTTCFSHYISHNSCYHCWLSHLQRVTRIVPFSPDLTQKAFDVHRLAASMLNNNLQQEAAAGEQELVKQALVFQPVEVRGLLSCFRSMTDTTKHVVSVLHCTRWDQHPRVAAACILQRSCFGLSTPGKCYKGYRKVIRTARPL